MSAVAYSVNNLDVLDMDLYYAFCKLTAAFWHPNNNDKKKAKKNYPLSKIMDLRRPHNTCS